MVGIATKYLGPTDFRGSRIVAWVPDRTYSGPMNSDRAKFRLTVPYSYELSGERLYHEAAVALAVRLDWIKPGEDLAEGIYVGGSSGINYIYQPVAV